MPSAPYIMAVTSQKGGSGRTTTTLALALAFARAGYSATLVDADRAGALSRVFPDGLPASWENLGFRRQLDWSDASFAGDIAIVDAPALTDPEAAGVLGRSGGILLTGLADPLSTRTIPSAIRALEAIAESNPNFELIGLLLNAIDADDALQCQIRDSLLATHPELILPDQIPVDDALRDWPTTPEVLESGPGFAAYRKTVSLLIPWIGPALVRSGDRPATPAHATPAPDDGPWDPLRFTRSQPTAPKFNDKIVMVEPRSLLRRRPLAIELLKG